MARSYLDYLFLATFSTKEEIKPSSLYHILTGKRTVSVMMQAIRHDLEAYFALFPRLSQVSLEKRIQIFQQEGLLIQKENGYIQSDLGALEVKEYFDSHLQNDRPEQLRYALILPKFRKRILFLTQVLSELRYHNTQYFPLEERASEQLWLKQFLSSFGETKEKIGESFGKEWLMVLEKSRVPFADLFVLQLEGHTHVRKTAGQSIAVKEMEEAEVLLYWHHGWLQILLYLEQNKKDSPIFRKVYHELTQNGGLCAQSTQETYSMWVAGKTPQQIAAYRKLKESTINDHFTEMAILYPTFPFEKFLSKEMLRFVEGAIENKVKLHYSTIQKEFPDISFFESRLMQIMNEVQL